MAIADPADEVDGARGRLAWAGPLAALSIQDQPDAVTRGGTMTNRGWALTFDIVHGPPLPPVEPLPNPASIAVGDTVERWGRRWQLVEISA